jgi:hypothetical protein
MSLDQFDKAYDDAEVNNEFAPVPDGTYQVFVDEVTMKETKKEPKRPMLSWKFQIVSGSQKGRFLFKNTVVSIESKDETQRSLSFIKTDLSICGVELEKFSDIASRLGDLLNANLEVKVSTKGEYQNIYLQKMIDVSGEVTDDDIPF